MSDQQLPEPLSSPDCNLRGLEWMPLDVVTLPNSDLWLQASGDACKAAVTLWCKAWLQVPAGSLPNDDKSLATLAQSDSLRAWKKVRDQALRGWVLCSDGRLYHPVLAKKAMEALPLRQEFLEKKSSETDRKVREREERKRMFSALKSVGLVPAWDIKTRELRELYAKHFPSESGGSEARPAPAATMPSPPLPVTPPVTPVTPPVTPDVTARTGHDLTGHDTLLIPPSGVEGAAAPTPTPSPAPSPAPTPAPPAPSPAPSAKPEKRPSRKCPPDFEVTAELVQWASSEAPLLDLNALKRETAKFRDHTFETARSDWPATWRNWIRRAHEATERELARQQRALGGRPPSSPLLQETPGQRQAREDIEALTGGRVSARRPAVAANAPNDGPPAGHPATLIPPEEDDHVAPRPLARLPR